MSKRKTINLTLDECCHFVDASCSDNVTYDVVFSKNNTTKKVKLYNSNTGQSLLVSLNQTAFSTWEDLCAFIDSQKACLVELQSPTVTIDNEEPLNVAKFWGAIIDVCDSEGNKMCAYYCNDDGEQTWTVGSDVFASEAELFEVYPKCVDKVDKYFMDTVWYTENAEDVPDKLKTAIPFDRWTDGVTICLVPCGEVPLEDESNLIKEENYTKMNITQLGQGIIESPLIATEFPYKADGITVCSDETAQDIVALIEASPLYTDWITELTAKFPLPAGGVYGISKVSAKQFSGTPKRNVHCDILDAPALVSSSAQISVVGLGNTSLLTVGGVKPYGKPLKPIAVVTDTGECVTCNDNTCQLAAGDILATGLAGTATHYDFCVTCFIDPTAANVLGGGGK